MACVHEKKILKATTEFCLRDGDIASASGVGQPSSTSKTTPKAVGTYRHKEAQILLSGQDVGEFTLKAYHLSLQWGVHGASPDPEHASCYCLSWPPTMALGTLGSWVFACRCT